MHLWIEHEWIFRLRTPPWPQCYGLTVWIPLLLPAILHTSKSSSNWHVHGWWRLIWNQWNFFFKWPKTKIFFIWGPKNRASEAHILHTSRSTHEACENFLRKWPNTRILTLWGPKWPRNWAFEDHIVHISESSSNEHIKQEWCESKGNVLLQNIRKPEFLLIWRSKNLGLWGLSFTHLQNYLQWVCKSSFKWIQ